MNKHMQDKPHEFEQGRFARRNGISKDDAPYDTEDANHKAWLAGWKFEDKYQDKTGSIEDQLDEAPETQAKGQVATTSDAKH